MSVNKYGRYISYSSIFLVISYIVAKPARRRSAIGKRLRGGRATNSMNVNHGIHDSTPFHSPPSPWADTRGVFPTRSYDGTASNMLSKRDGV